MRRTRWVGFWLAALPATNLLAVLPLPMLSVALAAVAPLAALALVRAPLPKSFVAPLAAAGSLVPAAFWTPDLLTTLSAAMWVFIPMALPVLLIRTHRGVARFFEGVIAVSLLVVIVAPSWGDGRLMPKTANIIELGRVAAFGALVAGVLAIGRGRPRLLLVAVPSAYVALATGSRGPILGLVAAGSYLVLGVRLRRRRRTRFLHGVSLVGLIGSAVVAWSAAPDESLARFALIHDGNSEMRARMFDEAVSRAMHTPGGLGWGQFGDVVDWLRADAYPHNMLLEIWVEGGLIAGLTFLALTLWPIVGLFRHRDLLGRLVGASLVFWVVAASFSGSFFFNRGFFLMIGVGWATRQILRRGSSTARVARTTAPAATDQRAVGRRPAPTSPNP